MSAADPEEPGGDASPTPTPSPTPNPKSATRGRRAISVAFYVLVIAILVWYLGKLDLGALAAIDLRWGFLAAALALGVTQRLLLPVVWTLILRDLGARVRRYPEYNLVYAKGWMGRYVPGKVAMVAVRVYLADTLGAGREAVGIASVAEMGTSLLVATIVGLVGVSFAPAEATLLADARVFAWIGAGVLALGLAPPVFNAVMRLGLRVLRRPVDAVPQVRATTLAWAAGGLACISCLTGGLAVLMAAAVDPAALDHGLYLWGAYHLGAAVGMAFIFTPSGLGAREGVYLGLLSLLFSPEAALAITVLSRLMEVAIDLAFYAVSVAWGGLARRSRTPPA